MKITKEQLKNLNEDCIEIIQSYMNENNLTTHQFAKKCGVHPNQLYLYLNRLRGLNITTMQKIGTAINE